MKTKNIFLALLVTLLSVSSVMANGTPPAPDEANATTEEGEGPPPDMPIDENRGLLLGAALVLGITLIYKNKEKKASV